MNVIRSLWSSIQGDPMFMRRVNGWLTVFWIVMIPISLVTGWISSVTYVAALSLWALVSGHWSAWQAARVEVRQEEKPAAVHSFRSSSASSTSSSRRQRSTSSPKVKVMAVRGGG
jgi:hypothetical protein